MEILHPKSFNYLYYLAFSSLLEAYQGVVKFDHYYAAFPDLRVLESFIMELCELI
jgi:hypothetical protein